MIFFSFSCWYSSLALTSPINSFFLFLYLMTIVRKIRRHKIELFPAAYVAFFHVISYAFSQWFSFHFRLNLEKKKIISFEEFYACFKPQIVNTFVSSSKLSFLNSSMLMVTPCTVAPLIHFCERPLGGMKK